YSPATISTYTLSLHDALPIYLSYSGAARHFAVLTAGHHLPSPTQEEAFYTLLGQNLRQQLRTPGPIPSVQVFGALFELYIHLPRSEEHTSELQSRENLVCRLL